MKACVIQPPYSMDPAMADECFSFKLEQLKKCDETMDIIVLPEYSDDPCCTNTREDTLAAYERYSKPLLDACAETAKRCHSMLFVNGLYEAPTGYRNTTYAFNRQGEIVGKYFKKHLPPLEFIPLALDSDYTMEFSEPYILEMEGLRFGFLTCYDFYFYEAFPNIARQKVDIIIGCSLQRSDSHQALEIMCRFLAYNTNAYVLRSSVSMDENSKICGASMIVDPFGTVLANLESRRGMATAEFDPAHKYYKPAGFGGDPAPHYEYMEWGRHPWQYRPAGSAIVRPDEWTPYPRTSMEAPAEKTLESIGAAVATDIQEIALPLSDSPEGILVYATPLENILKKFSCHTIFHLKIGNEEVLKKLPALLHRYDSQKHVFLTLPKDLTPLAKELLPTIRIAELEKRNH
ncbi:MAG: carbon-nitrogen hydrolase family protein [Clostridia bacterium]|nr:carbon-nitrogen hydrolase family protein [Clostridia bacterium]